MELPCRTVTEDALFQDHDLKSDLRLTPCDTVSYFFNQLKWWVRADINRSVCAGSFQRRCWIHKVYTRVLFLDSPIDSDLLTCIQRMLPSLGVDALSAFKVDFGKYLVGQSIVPLFFVKRNL